MAFIEASIHHKLNQQVQSELERQHNKIQDILAALPLKIISKEELNTLSFADASMHYGALEEMEYHHCHTQEDFKTICGHINSIKVETVIASM